MNWQAIMEHFHAWTGLDNKTISFDQDNLLVEGLFVDRVSRYVVVAKVEPSSIEPLRKHILDLCSADRKYCGNDICCWQEAWTAVLCAGCYLDVSKIPQRSSSTSIGKYIRSTLDHPTTNWTNMLLDQNYSEGFADKDDDLLEPIREMMKIITDGSYMFITEKGFLGIMQNNGVSMSIGDSVLILAGGQMPFVLRENSSEAKEITVRIGELGLDGSTWNLLGSCYLHGFMDGNHNEELLKEQGGYTTVRIV